MRKNTNMPMNPEIPPEPDSERAKLTRTVAHELDIMNTRLQPELKEHNEDAIAGADMLIREVDEFLAASKGELTSREELEQLLQKLNTAIAISNNPAARNLRQYLLEHFGDT